jgi:hypothetical protein
MTQKYRVRGERNREEEEEEREVEEVWVWGLEAFPKANLPMGYIFLYAMLFVSYRVIVLCGVVLRCGCLRVSIIVRVREE